MDLLNRAYSQLYQQYRSMTPGSRLMAGLLAAVALASAGYLYTHQAATPDVDLMHGAPLAASQLPAIEAALGEANLKGYQIRDEARGLAIYVPQGQEADYMAALAKAKALPPELGASQRAAASSSSPWDAGWQRDRQMLIAKQEDLALEICKRPGIETASVHLDIDKPGGFREKVITALASVKPLGNERLDKAQVVAIRRHMAGAVAGLKPENVTVADLNGPTWCGDADETVAGDSRVVPPKQGYPQELKAKTVNPSEPPPADLREAALSWISRSWGTLSLIGLGLLGLLSLRSMARSAPCAGNARPDDATEEEPTEPPRTRRRHRTDAAGQSFREEISAIVEDDPETAANVLRTWIGQSV